MAHAAIAESVQMQMAAKELSRVIVEIVNSSHFDRNNILQRELKLSQAYCLMWQDQESGEVDERMLSYERNAGCVAAVLIDLAALGMIEIDVELNVLCGISYTNAYVKVVCDSPAETFLDDALYDKIRAQHKRMVPHKELHEWIKSDIKMLCSNNKCASVTLKSLVDLGILTKKKKFIGEKFPTADPEPKKVLVDEVRKIALEKAEPDNYMRALLAVLRAVDHLHVLRDPLLKRHFTSKEFKKAKKRIKAVVFSGKGRSEIYEPV